MSEPWTVKWEILANEKPKRGGQGSVTKVSNKKNSEIGALKVLHNDFLNSNERRHRLRNEVLALDRINGEGLPAVIDHNMIAVNEKDVPLYFVASWIDGKTLEQYTCGRPLSIDDSLRITRNLASTLVLCHAAGVCHRDIKPSNIIILPGNNNPVLVDFGMAYILPERNEDKPEVSGLGQEIGNRFLRLPEYAPGNIGRDSRSDVSQLVAILFFLLSGKAPRVLIDSKGLPPHEANPSHFPSNHVSDIRWKYINRIFRVGFQPGIDLRFQTVQDLIARIDEVIHPIITTEQSFKNELDEFKELMSSKRLESKKIINDSLRASSDHLYSQLSQFSKEFDLSAAGNHSRKDGYAAFNLHIRNETLSHISVRISHFIKLVGESLSFVAVGYFIESEEQIIYYNGPAADIERLEEEVLAKGKKIFVEATNVLRPKIEGSLL